MKLYGTVTSPFVRRVRIVAMELAVPIELVDTATDAGQKALAEVTPLRKVPTAVIDGATVFDSRVIDELLFARHGHGPFRPMGHDVDDWNMLNAIDGALEAAIRLFYFRRDGVAIEAVPYMVKERDRFASTMEWIASKLQGAQTTPKLGLGYPELALATALDWYRLREMFPVDADPRLVTFAKAWADRPSFLATRPR